MSDFKAKMHEIRFPLGLRPRPRWRNLQLSADSLAVFKGATSKESEQEGGREGEGREGKGRGGLPPTQLGSLDPPVCTFTLSLMRAFDDCRRYFTPRRD